MARVIKIDVLGVILFLCTVAFTFASYKYYPVLKAQNVMEDIIQKNTGHIRLADLSEVKKHIIRDADKQLNLKLDSDQVEIQLYDTYAVIRVQWDVVFPLYIKGKTYTKHVIVEQSKGIYD